MRTRNIYSLSNSEVCYSFVNSTHCAECIRFPEPLPLITGSLYTSPHFLHTLASGNHNFTLCFYEFGFLQTPYVGSYSFCLSLSNSFSLGIMPSRSNHNGRVSFPCVTEWQSTVYRCRSFVIHPPVNGHLGPGHVLGIVDNAAVDMGVQIYLGDSDLISIRYIPNSGLHLIRSQRQDKATLML